MRDPETGRYLPGESGNVSGVRRVEPPPLGYRPPPRIPADLPLERLDSWVSALTGIGTHERDKRMSHQLRVNVLTYEDAISLWRGDDLAARAVTMVPEEVFSRGYDINFANEANFEDLKEDVEEQILELKLDELVERALCYERAFGGAAILMDVDDGRTVDQPMDPAKIKKINALTVLEPIEIYPASYYQDPASAKYGEPEYYRLQSFTVSGAGTVIGVTDRRAPPPTTLLIHETRLVVFGGIRVSRYQRNTSLMGPLWGDSVFIRLIEILRDFNVAWSAAGLLPIDFAQSVISIENLMQLVATHPDKLAARMSAVELSRSVARVVLVDAKEKYQRESTNLSGLPELMNTLAMRLAAALDTPMIKLFGHSPAGLGNPGANELADWHDRIRSIQRRRVCPILRFFVKLLMKTLRQRKLPSKWDIVFRNLTHQTEKDIAEARLTQSRADSMTIKSGIATSDEIRKARFNGRYSFETPLDPDVDAPGFVAPLPMGVVPKPDPAMKVVEAVEANDETTLESQNSKQALAAHTQTSATQKVKAAAPTNAHVVRGYARRNPAEPRLGANPKEGGDTDGDSKERRDADGPGTHRRFANMDVVVESPRGSKRQWRDQDGTTGYTKMLNDYGYLPGVNGADGDSLDCYLGPNEDAENVYIIHQNKAPHYILHDEDKVVLGADTVHHARDIFLAHRDDDRAFGGMTVMHKKQFMTVFGLEGRAMNSHPERAREVNEESPLHSVTDTMVLQETRNAQDNAALKALHGDMESSVAPDPEAALPGRVPAPPQVPGSSSAADWEGRGEQNLSTPAEYGSSSAPDYERALPRQPLPRGENVDPMGSSNAEPPDSHLADSPVKALHLDRIEQRGSKWVVLSQEGKELGSYETKNEAVQRLRQIEYFKSHPEQGDAYMNVDAPHNTPRVPDPAPGDREIIGGWAEEETSYEIDEPPFKKHPKDATWNAGLQTSKEEDE